MGAINSSLKLSTNGYRDGIDGVFRVVGSFGQYWSSSISGTDSIILEFLNNNSYIGYSNRVHGFAIRCIKN
jgi:hypothetical protein